MDNKKKQQQVEAMIRKLDHEMPESWGGPTTWDGMDEMMVRIIVDLKEHMWPSHVATLATISVMARRQSRRDRNVPGREAADV